MNKILVISSKNPFGARDGASIRTGQMIRMLSQLFVVDVAYTSDTSEASVDRENIRMLCNDVHAFPEPVWKRVLQGLLGVFKSKPLQCCYFYSSRLNRFIKEKIGGYDFVFCNNIRTAQYVDKVQCTKIIDYVDAISMNYAKEAQLANILLRLLYQVEAKRLIKYEQHVLNTFDKHFIISNVDRDFILAHAESKSHPIGIIGNSTVVDDEIVEQIDSRDIVFVGSMFYKPNIIAVTTFAHYVLPLILKEEPSAHFYIVGSRPVRIVRKLKSEHITVTGFVEDPKEYLRKASVVVVPMYSGAGVQNKILEAMAIGCCVVTTQIGAEGLNNIKNGKEIFIRSAYDSMAQQVVELMRDRIKRKEVGICAKNYIKDNLTFDKIFNCFHDELKEYVRRHDSK